MEKGGEARTHSPGAPLLEEKGEGGSAWRKEVILIQTEDLL